MRYSIEYLPETVDDREIVRSYLSQFYPTTVKKFFKLLKSKTARLKSYPYSCPKYEDDPDYRVLVVGDYLVFYMVDEQNKTVVVHRIFHGSQDITRNLD